MSQTHPGMTIGEYFAYLRNVATQHAELRHGVDGRVAFAKLVLTDALDQLYGSIKDIALLVEPYEEEGIDQKSDNLQTLRHAAFHVIARLPAESSTIDQRVASEDRCQRVAKQVLARMRKDSRNPADRRFAQLHLDKWMGNSSSVLFGKAYVAWRIEVPFTQVDRGLIYDAGDWLDDSNPSNLVDVHALSCPNINHPDLGLTVQQRLGCVLPRYDFSDAPTLAALSDQQRADLIAAFGSGSPSPVTIVDQDGNVLATVAAGGTYEVELADTIADPGAPTDPVIVDPL